MDADGARDFLRTHHRAVLATYRRDGSVQLSPVLCAVDGDGRVVISTRATTVKARHLERTPRAFLCAFTDAFFGPWVQVEGPVEIVRLPEAVDALVDYYRRVAGEHPNWDDYRAAMERDQRVLLRLTVERAGPTDST